MPNNLQIVSTVEETAINIQRSAGQSEQQLISLREDTEEVIRAIGQLELETLTASSAGASRENWELVDSLERLSEKVAQLRELSAGIGLIYETSLQIVQVCKDESRLAF